jgi:hypothetical protein
MPELSLQDIDKISSDISMEEISFSHLPDDLIDHVCCDVEHEMQNGLAFSEAYRRVRQKMGKRRLKEIQEETLYSVDTKYRHMKNTMKISGIAGTVLFGFAALFKIQHWPLAGTMLTFGALILTFVFMPSVLGVLWKETHNTKKLFLFISAFLAGGFFILGTLFKVQHWPGAGMILTLAAISGGVFFIPALLISRVRDQENKAKRPIYILGAAGVICYVAGFFFKIQHWPLAGTFMVLGVILLCFVAFPWYTWFTWKEENHVSARFLYIIIGILLIMVPGAMVNLNLQRPYENGFYLNQVQEQAMYNYLYRNNKSLMILYRDSLGYPEMEQLHSRTTELINYISDVQVRMIQESEGNPGKPAVSADKIKQAETGVEIQYRLLSKPFDPAPVNDFLMPECQIRKLLDVMVDDYMAYLQGLAQGEDLKKFISILTTANYLPSGEPDRPTSMMSGQHSLEFLKTCILTVEADVIKSIASR